MRHVLQLQAPHLAGMALTDESFDIGFDARPMEVLVHERKGLTNTGMPQTIVIGTNQRPAVCNRGHSQPPAIASTKLHFH